MRWFRPRERPWPLRFTASRNRSEHDCAKSKKWTARLRAYRWLMLEAGMMVGETSRSEVLQLHANQHSVAARKAQMQTQPCERSRDRAGRLARVAEERTVRVAQSDPSR